MTPTPDTALAARLAELQASSAPIMPGMPEHPKHGRAYARELKQAHRSGQLITLADHTAAVQSAVAKAVEASDKALQDALAYIDKGHHGMARNILAEAIRARKGDAL